MFKKKKKNILYGFLLIVIEFIDLRIYVFLRIFFEGNI